MLSDKDMHERMAKGWRMGKHDGTVCGSGSTRANTANIRTWLPLVCEKYGIATVCDAGAGDLHWIKLVQWPVKYRAFDLIPRHESVQQWDITVKALPECDAILCRTVLNHLCHERTQMAIEQFKLSARYLIATQYNAEDVVTDTCKIVRHDLRALLGEPLESVQDSHDQGCRLALWRI